MRRMLLHKHRPRGPTGDGQAMPRTLDGCIIVCSANPFADQILDRAEELVRLMSSSGEELLDQTYLGCLCGAILLQCLRRLVSKVVRHQREKTTST